MKSVKNLLAFLLGILMTAVLLGAVEVFFRINRETRWIEPVRRYRDRPQLDMEASRRLKEEVGELLRERPWTPRFSRPEARRIVSTDGSHKGALPFTVWRPQKREARAFQSRMYGGGGELIYSVQVSIDDHGRRVTPVPRKTESQILMFGDSYTLGEGVENRETAAWILGEKRPETKVYNLGVAGGGPNDCLYEMQTDRIGRLQDIPKIDTLVLYTFMNNHMDRLFARSSSVLPDNEWILDKPYYKDVNDEIRLLGGIREDRPFLNGFYRWFHSSATVEFFDLVLPPYFMDSDFKTFAKVLKAMEKASRDRFGLETKFVFVLFPDETKFYSEELKNAAAEQGIRTLDYSDYDMELITDERFIIPGDGHPSPPAHAVFAYLLDRDLPRF